MSALDYSRASVAGSVRVPVPVLALVLEDAPEPARRDVGAA